MLILYVAAEAGLTAKQGKAEINRTKTMIEAFLVQILPKLFHPQALMNTELWVSWLFVS
jgi:hypothetical protein